MKTIPALLVSACIAAGLLEGSRAQESPAPGAKEIVLSIPPADLIRLLPPAPENWKLTTSSARSEITAHPALQTTATRDYLYVPPLVAEQAAGEPKPEPPKTTRIMLQDTGFDATNFFAFQKFKPDAALPAGMKKYRVAGMQVVETVRENKRTLAVQVSDRFLVALITENQDEKFVAGWLRLLNLPALQSASQTAPTPKVPAGTLPLAFIDELHPEMNQVLKTSYLSKKEEEARQAEYDNWAAAYVKAHPEIELQIKNEDNIKK